MTDLDLPNRKLDERVDGVFISHPAIGFEEREAHIRSQFGEFGIPFEFIGLYSAAEITPDIRARFNIGPDLQPLGKVSNAINHMEAYRRIVERGLNRAIVFEDDVILSRRFHKVLGQALDQLESVDPRFCLFLANSMNRYVPWSELRPGKRVYAANQNRSPDAYLLTAATAKARLDHVAAHGMNTPHGHTYLISDKEAGIQSYWLSPTIVVPGSSSGRFKSSLDPKRQWLPGRKARWYWKMLLTRPRGTRLGRPDPQAKAPE